MTSTLPGSGFTENPTVQNSLRLGTGYFIDLADWISENTSRGLQNDDIFNVRDFGAVGDGITDDTDAIRNAVAAVNLVGSGTLFFPPGDYYIAQYRITGGPDANGVENFTFTNCNGLVISGYGATINLNGSFNRSADSGTTSYENTIVPFYMVGCTNFVIQGLEIDGNVEDTTKGASVIEGPCWGIATSNCQRYVLKDLNVHSLASDAIILGIDQLAADQQFSISNVKAWGNARNALSIIQARGGLITDSEFSSAGLTNASGTGIGGYGYHAPRIGIDVEPDADTPTVDVKTGDLIFLRCKLYNNQGLQFQAITTAIQNVMLSGCAVDVGTSTGTYSVVMAVDNGWLENNNFIVKRMDLTWSTNTGGRTICVNNRIQASGKGIGALDDSQYVLVQGNWIICTQTAAITVGPIDIDCDGAIFADNYVFMPGGAVHNTSGGINAVGLQNCLYVNNNTYQTDLSGSAGKYWYVEYNGTTKITNENFASSTRFRPGSGSTWDNAVPYNKGTIASDVASSGYAFQAQNVGARISLGDSDNYFYDNGFCLEAKGNPYDGLATRNLFDSTITNRLNISARPNVYNATETDSVNIVAHKFTNGTTLTAASAAIAGFYSDSAGTTKVAAIYPDGSLGLNSNKIIFGSAAPVSGAWAQGDIVFNTGAAASGFVGWVCVVAGSPGTWKTFGAISA